MHLLNPQGAMSALKDRVMEQAKTFFPFEGRAQILTLENIEADDSLDPEDFRSQRKAKLSGRTWSIPVSATLRLTDKKTGKVVDRTFNS